MYAGDKHDFETSIDLDWGEEKVFCGVRLAVFKTMKVPRKGQQLQPTSLAEYAKP